MIMALTTIRAKEQKTQEVRNAGFSDRNIFDRM